MAPNRILVALIDSKRFIGATEKHSYTYEHNNIRRIKLSIDTQTELRDYINVDFSKNDYVEGLLSVLETQNVYNTGGRTLALSPQQYMSDKTIFMFDLTKASSGVVSDTFQSVQHGNLRLHIEFSAARTNNTIVYFQFFFDSQVEVTADRQIVYTYNT